MDIVFTIIVSHIFGQNQINLSNPSFEAYGVNTDNKLEGWNTCLFADYSPPDVHSRGDFKWSNITPAYSGDSYLGLVVRPDSTGENISQQLVSPLIKNRYYSFKIHLAKPERYVSHIRTSGDSKLNEQLSESSVSFANAVKLQVWGFHETCDPGEMLYETQPIDNIEWKAYAINFKATADFQYIAFIPVYAQDRAYAGCILLDESSPIFETDASFSYSYEAPKIDSLFYKYETNFDRKNDKMVQKGAFVHYYP